MPSSCGAVGGLVGKWTASMHDWLRWMDGWMTLIDGWVDGSMH